MSSSAFPCRTMRSSLVALGLAAAAMAPSCPAATVPLGVVFAGERATGTLPLPNPGPAEAFFVGAESGCPCLRIQAEPALLPPGAAEELPFAYQSDDTGRFSVQVKLHGAEPDTVLAVHSVTGVVAERSWLVRAPELIDRREGNGVLVIDVRTPQQFARARIPRSVNQPLFGLKTSTQWRDRALVLVDEGSAPAELLAEARALRTAGFREVRVLEGGLASWVRHGGPLDGVGTLAAEVAQILPAQFERSRRTHEWQVIDLSSGGEAALDGFARLPSVPAGRLAPLVLVVGDEGAYARVEKRCGPSRVASLFYLKGGGAALQEFRTQQAALAAGPAAGVALGRPDGSRFRPSGCTPCGR